MDKTHAVYEANARAHDEFASIHDLSVPYIRRKVTRLYYWNLLSEAVARSGHAWQGSRVLELGCGTGTYTDACLENGVREYVGVDISPKMIELARAKHRNDRASFSCQSLEEFAHRGSESVDIAFSFSFLHHLPSIDDGLAQIKNVLSPGGVYIALHETDTNRAWTLLEKLDFRLQILCGYNEYSRANLGQRIKGALLGPPTAGGASHGVAAHDAKEDLVDYQIKDGFSLEHRCAGWGEIVPYCYLGFPELMVAGKPLNHQMLILKKTI